MGKNLFFAFSVLLIVSCGEPMKQEPMVICGNVFDKTDTLPPLIEDNCRSCHELEVDRRSIAIPFRKIRRKKLNHKHIVNFISNPKKFNDTAKMQHPVYDFLTRQQVDSIASWLDTL
jgi:hypothetical protein